MRSVGIDYLSIERFGSDGPKTHLAILGANGVIMEGLDLTTRRSRPRIYPRISPPQNPRPRRRPRPRRPHYRRLDIADDGHYPTPFPAPHSERSEESGVQKAREAHLSESLSHGEANKNYSPAPIATLWVSAPDAFGRLMLSTPFLNSDVPLAASTAPGRMRRRISDPLYRSRST